MKKILLLWSLLVLACNPPRLDWPEPGDAAVDGEVGMSDVMMTTVDRPSPSDTPVPVDRGVPVDVRQVIDTPPPQDVPAPLDRPVSPPDVPTPDVPVVVADVPPPRDVPPPDAGPNPLVAGDLLRGTSNATIYAYASDRRRYLFPNERTYSSWYASFNGIRTLTDAELFAIPIGGNITMRPGTWLVKITTDPKVYAVTRCGTLHWLESESVALALYGPNWNVGLPSPTPGPGVRRTQDIPDAFFVNYSIGSRISRATHPDGTLIRYPSRSERYVVMSGLRRPISTDAFIANRFQDGFVIETTIDYPLGTPVTTYEPLLSDPVCVL